MRPSPFDPSTAHVDTGIRLPTSFVSTGPDGLARDSSALIHSTDRRTDENASEFHRGFGHIGESM